MANSVSRQLEASRGDPIYSATLARKSSERRRKASAICRGRESTLEAEDQRQFGERVGVGPREVSRESFMKTGFRVLSSAAVAAALVAAGHAQQTPPNTQAAGAVSGHQLHEERRRLRQSSGRHAPLHLRTDGLTTPRSSTRSSVVPTERSQPAVEYGVFSPDGAILIAERPGRLRIVRNGCWIPSQSQDCRCGSGSGSCRLDGPRAPPADLQRTSSFTSRITSRQAPLRRRAMRLVAALLGPSRSRGPNGTAPRSCRREGPLLGGAFWQCVANRVRQGRQRST